MYAGGIVADILLAFIPFRAFARRLDLAPATRRRLRVCFLASLLIAIFSILSGTIRFAKSSSSERHGQTGAWRGMEAKLMAHLTVRSSQTEFQVMFLTIP